MKIKLLIFTLLISFLSLSNKCWSITIKNSSDKDLVLLIEYTNKSDDSITKYYYHEIKKGNQLKNDTAPPFEKTIDKNEFQLSEIKVYLSPLKDNKGNAISQINNDPIEDISNLPPDKGSQDVQSNHSDVTFEIPLATENGVTILQSMSE